MYKKTVQSVLRKLQRGESETELTEEEDRQRDELETGPDELLKQWNKGKHVCKADTIG